MNYVQFFQDGKEVSTLEFPVTEIGKSSKITLEIKNPNDFQIIIVDSFVMDPDIAFSEIPDSISPMRSVFVEFILTPTPGRGPLNTDLRLRTVF